MKVFRTDNDRNYGSNAKSSLMEIGIDHQLATPYSPAQTGVSERINRTLLESARCAMSHVNPLSVFWAGAISTANCLRN